MGFPIASDTLEEAQEACKDIEDYERCYGLCVHYVQHNGFTGEYEGDFWEQARGCFLVPEVVVIGQRPPEEDEAIVWPEWDTVEDLQPFYSYRQ